MKLAEKLYELSLRKDQINSVEASLKDLKKEFANLQEEIYIAMENDDLQSINYKDTTFYRRLDRYYSMPHKEAGMKFLKENGMGELIQPGVNARTLTGELIHFQEEGGELPNDVFSERIVQRIGMKK